MYAFYSFYYHASYSASSTASPLLLCILSSCAPSPTISRSHSSCSTSTYFPSLQTFVYHFSHYHHSCFLACFGFSCIIFGVLVLLYHPYHHSSFLACFHFSPSSSASSFYSFIHAIIPHLPAPHLLTLLERMDGRTEASERASYIAGGLERTTVGPHTA